MVDLSAFIQPALLSLALGALIGIERERSTGGTVGLRSFALACFFGFLVSYISTSVGLAGIIDALGFAGALAFSLMLYRSRSQQGKEFLGITTALAIPLTFLIGELVAHGFVVEAVASAIAIALLLAERHRVHAAVKAITHDEIVDGLVFAVIAFVIYPLVPAQPQVLLGYSFDLQLVWKVIVAASLLSYGAHLLAKYLHSRGVLIATFLGGAVSSLGIIHLYAHKHKRSASLLRFAFVTSSAGAYLADLILLLLIAPVLFFPSATAIIIATLVLAGFALAYSKEKISDGIFSKPLSFSFVLEFAVLFFAVELLSSYATSALGNGGLLLSSFIGGLASSTAVFASVATMFQAGNVSTFNAGLAMLLGLAGSFAVKLVYLYSRVSRKDFVKLLIPAGAALVAGGAVFFFLSPA